MAAQVEAPYAEGVSSKLSSFSVPKTCGAPKKPFAPKD